MFEFFMIVSIAGVMVCGIAFAVSRSQVKELETKLESQRQKREIDEAKRVELKTQLDAARMEIKALQSSESEFRGKAESPTNALRVLEAIVTRWREED